MTVVGVFVFLCSGTRLGFLRLLKEARAECAVVGRHVRVRKYLLRRRGGAITRPTASMALAWQAFVVAILSPAAGIDREGQLATIDILTTLGVVLALAICWWLPRRA